MEPSIVIVKIREVILENNFNAIEYLQEKTAFTPQTYLLLIDCLLLLSLAVILLKISLIFHSKCLQEKIVS